MSAVYEPGPGQGLNGCATLRGWSLIELMAALSIAAVLATLALPAFRQHVLRGYRGEARQALLALQLAQERYRSQHASYATDLPTLGVKATSPGDRYGLRIVDAGPLGYTLEARALGPQLADRECQRFVLRQFGAQPSFSATDADGQDRVQTCWPQ